MALDLAGLGWLPWRTAILLGALLLGAALVLRRIDRTRSASRTALEGALILGLYAAWQFLGTLRSGDLESALAAGRWVVSAQRAMGLPSEAAIQAIVLPHDAWVAVADWYYTSLHIPVFVITLVWVLIRHREDWAFARTTTALLTGACLLIQFKPLAPPRLLPELGIVDTAMLHGRSVYAAIPGANQFSAMPSVHIAWACLVALFIVVSARTSWRWLALAYPAMTFIVIIVTGNHFILDAVASVLLLGLAVGVTLCFPSQRPGHFGSGGRAPDDGAQVRDASRKSAGPAELSGSSTP